MKNIVFLQFPPIHCREVEEPNQPVMLDNMPLINEVLGPYHPDYTKTE